MQDLNEHNNAKRTLVTMNESVKKAPAGVLCPQCKTEMIHVNKHVHLMSNPAQQRVECPKCSYSGLKVV